MMRNIGGATPRITQTVAMSQPARYTFCFGENEEESPWEPLHVERGFSRETSTVTVGVVSSFINNATYTYDWKTILTVLADSMAHFGNNIVLQGGGRVWVLFNAEQATRLASYGLSKRDVKEYIWEKARFLSLSFPKSWYLIPTSCWRAKGKYRS